MVPPFLQEAAFKTAAFLLAENLNGQCRGVANQSRQAHPSTRPTTVGGPSKALIQGVAPFVDATGRLVDSFQVGLELVTIISRAFFPNLARPFMKDFFILRSPIRIALQSTLWFGAAWLIFHSVDFNLVNEPQGTHIFRDCFPQGIVANAIIFFGILYLFPRFPLPTTPTSLWGDESNISRCENTAGLFQPTPLRLKLRR